MFSLHKHLRLYISLKHLLKTGSKHQFKLESLVSPVSTDRPSRKGVKATVHDNGPASLKYGAANTI